MSIRPVLLAAIILGLLAGLSGCDTVDDILDNCDLECPEGSVLDEEDCSCMTAGYIDGDTADGDTPDGDTPDGDTPDGDTPDGDKPDGDTPDGDTPDGDCGCASDDDCAGDLVCDTSGECGVCVEPDEDGDIDGDVDGDEGGDVDEDGDVDGGDDAGINQYLVAVWHATNTADYNGNLLRIVELNDDGSFNGEGSIIETHDHIAMAVFSPDGTQLLVTHECDTNGGIIMGFDVIDSQIHERFDITLDGCWNEAVWQDNDHVILTDSTGEMHGGGVKRLDLSGDTPLIEDDYVTVHVPSGLVMHPSGSWLAIFGGEEMDDAEDMATIALSSAGFGATTFFDHWSDYTTMYGAGFSPDGGLLAAGNYSAYAADADTVRLFDFDNGTVTELDNTEVYTPSDATFSDDSATLYVSAFEDNRIEAFSVGTGTLVALQTVTGLPLADDIRAIRRGPLANHLLVVALTELVLFSVEADGTLADDPVRLDFGEDTEDIISGAAVGTSY